MSPVAVAGLMSVLVAMLDVKTTILGKSHYLLYGLATAMQPRWRLGWHSSLPKTTLNTPQDVGHVWHRAQTIASVSEGGQRCRRSRPGKKHCQTRLKLKSLKIILFSGWQAEDHHRVPNPHNPRLARTWGEGGTGDRRVHSCYQHNGGLCHSEKESRLLVDSRLWKCLLGIPWSYVMYKWTNVN